MRADLSKLARPSGVLAMVAVDQREALRGMFAKFQEGPVPDSQLTQFKVTVAKILSPFASGLLVDQEFGLDSIVSQKALSTNCGLIAAADLLIGPPGGAATETRVDPAIDPQRMRRIGSVGLKFLILWRSDESPDVRSALVEEFLSLCSAAGLPSIIEIIVKPPQQAGALFDREEDLIRAAKEAATWKPDLYKAEIPFYGEGDLDSITRNAQRITDVIGGPWVVLSNGVKSESFAGAVEACAKGGASGFLAGRAVWADIVGSKDISVALREVSIPRLEKLGSIVDKFARPWHEA